MTFLGVVRMFNTAYKSILILFVVRFVLLRLVPIILFLVLLIVLYLLASAPERAHGYERENCVVPVSLIAMPFNGSLAPVERGLVYKGEVFLKGADAILQSEGTYYLSGLGDQLEPFGGDDFVLVRFYGQSGTHREFSHKFQLADHQGVNVFGPVEVSDYVDSSLARLEVELWDLHPPYFWLSALYLVKVRPELCDEGALAYGLIEQHGSGTRPEEPIKETCKTRFLLGCMASRTALLWLVPVGLAAAVLMGVVAQRRLEIALVGRANLETYWSDSGDGEEHRHSKLLRR